MPLSVLHECFVVWGFRSLVLLETKQNCINGTEVGCGINKNRTNLALICSLGFLFIFIFYINGRNPAIHVMPACLDT